MRRAFVKMHGVGNDYIYFDCFESPLPHPENTARTLCDRHFSVGGDGIVLILPSRAADAKMRMFNADGSEGRMCGNAIRCVAKYLYERRGMRRPVLTVETLSGVKELFLKTEKDEVVSVTVDMGKPDFRSDSVPALFREEYAVDVPLSVGGKEYRVTCVSMGNPHCVVFTDGLDSLPLSDLGPLFERHPAFPERVNTEFVHICDGNRIELRVWERGSGETLACGTGACAAAAAAIQNGYFGRGEEISVRLLGGELTVLCTDTIFLTGPAAFAFEGTAETE